MKSGTEIATERLLLRHWHSSDIEAFHRLNSDDRVMSHFPFRLNRLEAAQLLERIRRNGEEDGYCWAAITRKDRGETIGLAGLSRVRFEASFTPATEIGWRLLPEFWGRGFATEAARALLRHGFEDLGFPEIVAFAVRNNHRSIAVMKRIGMKPAGFFSMPGIDESHKELRPHVLFRLAAGEAD